MERGSCDPTSSVPQLPRTSAQRYIIQRPHRRPDGPYRPWTGRARHDLQPDLPRGYWQTRLPAQEETNPLACTQKGGPRALTPHAVPSENPSHNPVAAEKGHVHATAQDKRTQLNNRNAKLSLSPVASASCRERQDVGRHRSSNLPQMLASARVASSEHPFQEVSSRSGGCLLAGAGKREHLVFPVAAAHRTEKELADSVKRV